MKKITGKLVTLFAICIFLAALSACGKNASDQDSQSGATAKIKQDISEY